MTRSHRWILAPLVVVVGLVATAAAPAAEAAGSTPVRCREIHVGYLARFSGPEAERGVNALDAARLATAEFDAEHPDCSVVIVPIDLGADSARLNEAVSQAVADPAMLAMIGPPRSAEVIAAAPALEAGRLPFVVVSATRTDLGAQGWRMFHRLGATDQTEGVAIARLITRELQPGQVAVVDDGSVYGADLAATVRTRLGRTPFTSVTLPTGATDLGAVVQSLAGLGADDVVVFAGLPAEGAALVTQLRAAGNRARIVGGDGLPNRDYVALAGAAAEGTLATGTAAPPERLRGGRAFLRRYTAAAGTPPTPGSWSVETYDATNVILDAVAAGARTRQAVDRALDRTRTEGLSGPIAFDRHGEVTGHPVWVFRIENGAIIPVESVTPRR